MLITEEGLLESKLFNGLEFEETKNNYIISNEHYFSPQLYYKKTNRGFIFTNRCDLMDLKIGHNFWVINGEQYDTLNLNEEDLQLPFQTINNYSKIVLSKGGKLDICPTNFEGLFSIPIIDAKNLIIEWRDKYLNLVDSLCKKGKFIPTLTGGVDTRVLTYFWRNQKNFDSYYLKAIKNDGKNDVEKGQQEIEISKKILDRFGFDLKRTENKFGKDTLTGKWTDVYRFKFCNDKLFLKNVVNKCEHSYGEFYPFIDDIYLKIKTNVNMRCLLLMLFCEDLLDIEILSKKKEGMVKFHDKYKDLIESCNRIISSWGGL